MNQTITTTTGDTFISLPSNTPNWISASNQSLTWINIKDELFKILKQKLKLKIEEFDTNIMISILLDDVEICKDYFMCPQSK